jgi:hypothetical protein
MTGATRVPWSLRTSAALLGLLGAGIALHHRYRNWGATPEEVRAAFPGDELVPEPAGSTTRAVTIDAPAHDVWPWLVQMGQGRAGLYSYDWLENLVGLDIHSSWGIEEQLQHIEVGDRIRLVPDGWMGLPQGMALPVARIEPGRSVVLREDPSEGPWNGVWSFHVVPIDHDRCRLVSRGRATQQGLLGRIADELMDPVTLVMTRKMLLGIKARAEQRAASRQRPATGTR